MLRKIAVRINAVIVGGILSGCALPHVRLAVPPPRTSSLTDRQEFYEDHQPTLAPMQVVTTINQQTGASSTSIRMQSLHLASSTEVFNSEDLRPLVRRSSLTAAAIVEEREIRRVGGLYSSIALGTTILSWIGVVGFGLSAASRSGNVGTPAFFTVLTLALGGTGATLIGGLHYNSRAESARQRAFITFDQSLRERLALCGDGSVPGDCADMVSNPQVNERPSP